VNKGTLAHWGAVALNGKKEKEQQESTVNHNSEARSRDHCCGGKAMRITYCECVFVALCIQHAKRSRHIFICGLSGSTIFFHVISEKTRFSGEKVIQYKMRILTFSTHFAWKISHSKKNSAIYNHISAFM
jgi:hypothetical protein